MLAVALLFAASSLFSAAVPPVPDQWVTDKAKMMSKATVDSLNTRLKNFEQETEGHPQVLVYTDFTLNGADLEDTTIEWFQKWGVGQRKMDNGLVMFIFKNDRKTTIRTGYGMEGNLPDATCKIIIDEMRDKMKAGDFDGAITDAVSKMITAAKGGKIVAATAAPLTLGKIVFWIFIILVLIVLVLIGAATGGSGNYSSSGGYSSSSGGSNSSSGYSSGGGGTGGGGASGSW